MSFCRFRFLAGPSIHYSTLRILGAGLGDRPATGRSRYRTTLVNGPIVDHRAVVDHRSVIRRCFSTSNLRVLTLQIATPPTLALSLAVAIA